jgi:hypothetical protein
MLTALEIGKNVPSVEGQSLRYCYGLKNIYIPDGVTIAEQAFLDCRGLLNIRLPDTMTTVSASTFKNCKNLHSIDVPDNVTSFGYNAFAEMGIIYEFKVPKQLSSFTSAFYSTDVVYFNFSSHTFVPTLSLTDFNFIFIVVPDALYDEWIAATNWSSYASNIVKASEFNA